MLYTTEDTYSGVEQSIYSSIFGCVNTHEQQTVTTIPYDEVCMILQVELFLQQIVVAAKR